MDFGALPPETNSARMYSGPGAEPMLAAAAAWDDMAASLHSTAASYAGVISGLTEQWRGGASLSMAAAAAPYGVWLRATAAQAEQAAAQARAAAAAYQAALAMTVPPPVIATNRAQLMSLVATNVLGQNTPAIAATEAHYAGMWVQDTVAMYSYAGSSAAATTLAPFTPPPQSIAGQVASVGQITGTAAASTQATLSQAMSQVPQALQSLAAPLSSTSTLSSTLDNLKTYLYPVSLLSTFPMRAMSMLNTAKSLGSTTAAAAKEIPAAASAVTGALAPAGLTGTVSAGMAQATSVGGLSAPHAWAAAAGPVVSPTAATLTGSGLGSAAATDGTSAAIPPLLPLANMAGRGVSGATVDTRFLLRPTMLPSSPAVG